MGTYTAVHALPCAPEHARRPIVSAAVANFGVHSPKRREYDRSDPQSVLGRFLFGFADERGDARWITYDPDAVIEVRRDVVQAVAIAHAARAHDEYADWFEGQLREADRVLSHAARHREWVVAVFEGDDPCFRRGGTPEDAPGRGMFDPQCTVPPSRSRIVPLGVAGVLVAGLAIAGWRHRRLLLKRT